MDERQWTPHLPLYFAPRFTFHRKSGRAVAKIKEESGKKKRSQTRYKNDSIWNGSRSKENEKYLYLNEQNQVKHFVYQEIIINEFMGE